MSTAIILASSLIVGASCSNSDHPGEASDAGSIDPYAAVSPEDLPLKMLTDIKTIPAPPSGTTCDPEESHCAHIYVFNKAGLLIAEQWRSFGLEPSETHRLTYDASNRLLQVTYSLNPAYTTDAIEKFEYDASNRVTKKLFSYVTGSSAGGSRESVFVYSGNLANVTAKDRNSSGTVTRTWSGTFTYDAANNLVKVASADYTKDFTYNGRLVTDMRDKSASGRVYHEHYIYNAQRNIIRVEPDYAPADGIVESVGMYTYKPMDVTNDNTIDINIGYKVHATIERPAIGTSDGDYQSARYNTAGELNWGGLDTGTCSTCGDMQGQINKVLLGL